MWTPRVGTSWTSSLRSATTRRSCQSSWFLRCKTTLARVEAAPDAPRLVPTPVVLLAARRFNGPRPAKEIWSSFLANFSKHGFESLLLDVDPDEVPTSSSDAVLDKYEDEVKTALRTASSFPPILLCQGNASLIGEKYASSHGLSALVMVNPAASVAQISEDVSAGILPSALTEFDFEPRFPCRIAWSNDHLDRLQADGQTRLHRIEEELIEEGEQDSRIIWTSTEAEGPEEIRTWLEDDCGILANSNSAPYSLSTRQNILEEEELEEEEEDQDEEEDSEHEPYEDEHDQEKRDVVRSGPRQMPDWFLAGKYAWAKSGSKKMPLELDERDIREEFHRGSGKGGQAINKNRSRCDLLHKPTGLVVRCQKTRSLDDNRRIARRILSQTLDEQLRGRDSVRGTIAAKKRKQKQNKAKKQRKRNAKTGAEEDPLASKEG